MYFKNITLEKKEQVAKITLNRPKLLNALNSETRKELISAIKDVKKDKNARVLIITGAGRAFTAGQDIAESKEFDEAAAKQWIREFDELYEEIRGLEIPYVAAINGYAVGAGLQLALLADIRISSENGKFGMGEIDIGIPCILGSALLWPLVGMAKTIEIVLTGDVVEAKEAERIGLVNKIVGSRDELEDVSMETARRLAGKPPVATKLNKVWFRKKTQNDFEMAIEQGAKLHSIAFASGEPREYMEAFLEKRRSKS